MNLPTWGMVLFSQHQSGRFCIIGLLLLLLPNISWAKLEKFEYHFYLCEKDLDKVLDRLPVKNSSREERHIYFFDTLKKDYYQLGVILRARVKKGKSHSDLTLKLRPYDSDRLDSRWQDQPSVECERDYRSDENQDSCSNKYYFSSSYLQQQMEGKQKGFITERTNYSSFLNDTKELDLFAEDLHLYGPAQVNKWELSSPKNAHWEWVLEAWSYDGATDVIEISYKSTSENSGERERKILLSEIKRRHLNLCPAPKSKTLRTLEYFTQKWAIGREM